MAALTVSVWALWGTNLAQTQTTWPDGSLYCESVGSMGNYCGFGNFRVTFISRFFLFRIIRKFLNSRASIRVVGHFRGLKIGPLCISWERQINVMHRIAAHAVRQLKLEILFTLCLHKETITQFVTHRPTDSHWTASESIIRYSITLN